MTTQEAVIEIGSTGIRLSIADVQDSENWTFIDHAELPIALGWDVFTTGLVSRETLLQCLQILSRFKEQITTYEIPTEHITVIATSALREAINRDTVLDRILIKTGLAVKIIDGLEENRLMYIAVLHGLKDQISRFKTQNSIIIDVGGGSTEMMLFNKGEMVAVHSLRLGTIIIEQHIKSMMGSQKDIRRFLEEYINNMGVNLNKELALSEINQIIAIGQEARLAAQIAGKQISDNCWTINRKKFASFVENIQKYTEEEKIAKFKISYAEAQALNINLLTYKLFINQTGAEDILVLKSSLHEGIIISKYSAPNTELQENFFSQVVASALNLCRKYSVDEKHATYVRNTALKL